MPYPGFEQKYSAASYCQLQLPMFFTFCDVYHQCQAMSELCLDPCSMESSQMPLPGCWIYAAYLFKDKFKALNTLLNIAEYTITRKRVFCFHAYKPCLNTATGGLYVTISSQLSHVVVYTLQLRGQINSFCFSSTLVSSVDLPTEDLGRTVRIK